MSCVLAGSCCWFCILAYCFEIVHHATSSACLAICWTLSWGVCGKTIFTSLELPWVLAAVIVGDCCMGFHFGGVVFLCAGCICFA